MAPQDITIAASWQATSLRLQNREITSAPRAAEIKLYCLVIAPPGVAAAHSACRSGVAALTPNRVS